MRITRGDGLLTRRQAAQLCGVQPKTISAWVTRGHLTPTTVEAGHPLYDPVELAKAEYATRKRARRTLIHAGN